MAPSTAASIRTTPRLSREAGGFWVLNGAAGEALQHGMRGSGLAPSLDAAKAAWRGEL
jgi:hypothetical protein